MVFEEMRYAITDIMQKIHMLPFNVELAKGTLAKEKFIFYLEQDAMYLTEFSKALALTSVKLPNNELRLQFLKFSEQAITAEQELHINFLKKYRFEEKIVVKPTPACFMYTHYLLNTASLGTVEEAVASLLPCFYIYREVGKQIAKLHQMENPYQAWINLYSGEEFDASVSNAINVVNQVSENASDVVRCKMIDAFVTSTKLEWLFWQSAYQLERWGI